MTCHLDICRPMVAGLSPLQPCGFSVKVSSSIIERLGTLQFTRNCSHTRGYAPAVTQLSNSLLAAPSYVTCNVMCSMFTLYILYETSYILTRRNSRSRQNALSDRPMLSFMYFITIFQLPNCSNKLLFDQK